MINFMDGLMSLFRLEYPNTQALMKHRVIN